MWFFVKCPFEIEKKIYNQTISSYFNTKNDLYYVCITTLPSLPAQYRLLALTDTNPYYIGSFPTLKHTTTLFSLSKHYILSGEWRVVVT